MDTFDYELCPIKLGHISTEGDGDFVLDGAFADNNCGRAAFLILRMMKDQAMPGMETGYPAGELRIFTHDEFIRYCEGCGLMPWVHYPSFRKGFERLIEEGYLIPRGGAYMLTLQLVARAFAYSPEPTIIGRHSTAHAT